MRVNKARRDDGLCGIDADRGVVHTTHGCDAGPIDRYRTVGTVCGRIDEPRTLE